MYAIETTCCFTGHRPKYFPFGTNENHPECKRIKSFIREKCRYLIEAGVTHFISGGALGVDTWAMEEVIGLRETFPRITLECVIPYAGMIERFPPNDRERFARTLRKLAKFTILKERYYTGCMQDRNKYMVDRSRYVIAVWTGQRSGTGNTIQYAEKLGRKVHCLEYELNVPVHSPPNRK
ncbi:MAG: DUF1273 domain-containing protein [Planctomycetes bacterium]|nr:DUF1273 domain-containing protein [Planctomycetota bacterium]